MKMKHITYANLVIIDSLPLRRDVKKFFLHFYEHKVRENGTAYANSLYKSVRLVFMNYMARTLALEEVKSELQHLRMPLNAPMMYMLGVARTQPHVVLDFWKLPSGNPQNNPSEERTYRELIDELLIDDFQEDEDTIIDIKQTIQFLKGESCKPRSIRRPGLADAFERIHRLDRFARKLNRAIKTSDVHPTDYKSCEIDPDTGAYSCPDLIRDREEYRDMYPLLIGGLEDYVQSGEIHLVAKGSDDFRAVAAPNRFIQRETVPSYTWLSELTHRTRTDATYNQSRFDQLIQGWVERDDIHPYGVDIHHATNHLPWSHCNMLLNELLDHHAGDLASITIDCTRLYPYNHLVKGVTDIQSGYQLIAGSANLFKTVSKAEFRTPYGAVRFKKGQPLGLLPSFRMLNFQNMLYAEVAILRVKKRLTRAIAQMQETYSPADLGPKSTQPRVKSLFIKMLTLKADLDKNQQYCVLGDDVVFKRTRIAEEYIKLLTSMNIPLSLHKSFKGKLVEFAGKVYIRGQKPRYITDHHILTWNNLFDWQVATKVPIPWNRLPKNLRNRWTKVCMSVDRGLIPTGVYNNIVHSMVESTASERWKAYLGIVDQVMHEKPRRALDTSSQVYGILDPTVLEPDRVAYYRDSQGLVSLERIEAQGYTRVKVDSLDITRYLDYKGLPRKNLRKDSGRPCWKSTKFKLASTDTICELAAVTQEWINSDSKRGLTTI